MSRAEDTLFVVVANEEADPTFQGHEEFVRLFTSLDWENLGDPWIMYDVADEGCRELALELHSELGIINHEVRLSPVSGIDGELSPYDGPQSLTYWLGIPPKDARADKLDASTVIACVQGRAAKRLVQKDHTTQVVGDGAVEVVEQSFLQVPADGIYDANAPGIWPREPQRMLVNAIAEERERLAALEHDASAEEARLFYLNASVEDPACTSDDAYTSRAELQSA